MAEVTGGGGVGAPNTGPQTTSGGTSILGIPTGGGSEDNVTQGLLGTLVSLPKYTSLNDMFNGGGPGAYGDTFMGGSLSGLLNALGISPVAPTQAEIERIAALTGATTGGDAVSQGISAPATAPVYTPPVTQTRPSAVMPTMPTSPATPAFNAPPGDTSYFGRPYVAAPGGGEYEGSASVPDFPVTIYENPTTPNALHASSGLYAPAPTSGTSLNLVPGFGTYVPSMTDAAAAKALEDFLRAAGR